jgi:8-oxo-dGTP pyrophosphatase MutT (NUDIX family)
MTGDIIAIRRIDARLASYDWSFSRERRAEIEACWAAASAEKPAMFNGRILLQHHGETQGDVFVARYFETDYADFLAWLRLGYPPPSMRNGFAMAALQARDGAFLLGVMGDHTANAGRIYFPSGTPDRDDLLPDGTVDLAGSAERELYEETGLRRDEATAGEGWLLAIDKVRAAFMRPFYIDLPAEEARRLILSRIAAQAEPELADVHIVRAKADILRDRMPGFMQEYLDWALARGDQR